MQDDRHIIAMPKGLLALRILQIVFALMVVGLTAFLIANTIGFVFSSTGFAIFVGIMTLVIVTYDLVSEKSVKNAYNMWAVLSLDITMVIFWLSAMGSLAALRAAFSVYVDYSYKKQKRYVYAFAGDTYLAILSATAGVAAIELILFIVSLVMFSMHLHRHRKSNAPNAPVSSGKIELQQSNSNLNQSYANNGAPYAGNPNYQPPVMQPQHTGASNFSPMTPQAPYQNTMTPPPQGQGYPKPTGSPGPQYMQQVPQYSNTQAPQGYHEADGQYR